MKMTVDIDCTPEEARRFIGLPDLTPVHDVYIDKMKRVVTDGITPDMVESMMRGWGPMGEAGMSMWRKMVEQMGSLNKT